MPELNDTENKLPYGLIDLGNGYNSVIPHGDEAAAITQFLDCSSIWRETLQLPEQMHASHNIKIAMFFLDTSDSSFNFSSSSLFPSLTSNPLLALPTDHANDNTILPPLQNNGLSLAPTQQQSFAPYSTNSLINQVNVNQCNTLEWHLVKVTTEHDTIKNLFDQLASVVKSTLCDTSLLSGTTPLQVLTTTDKKPLMHETHPNMHFWTKKNFNDWLDSTEAEESDCRIYAYLEEESGKVPSSEMLANIHRSLHAGWRELTQSNMALETWGKASIKAHQFLRFTMEKAFPLFKFTENRWKLKYICTKMYPAWSKCYLDKNRKLKCKTCDAVKEEALNKPEEDYKLSSKKQRTGTETEESCSKKVKESTMAQSNPQQACIAPVVEENAPVVSHLNITQPVVSYNPMGLLAMAATKVKIMTVPPIPELPVKCNLGMTHISEAEHQTNLSNGVPNTLYANTTKNLCMLQWLKQLNPNRQKDDFHMYYDKTLTLAQHKAYDTEAKQLVEMNGWTKVIIKLNTLY
ncbi:hypothetical protein V8B97DRAFT_2025816 [Scleroderma yunnanense]